MQVGMSTASLFNKCDLEEAPAKLAQFCVEICEVFLNTFSEYEYDFISLLLERVQEARLTVYSLHPMGTQYEPQLFSLYHRQRSDALKIFQNVLQAGKRLGAQYYIMHGPANLGGAVKNMQLSRIGPMVRELCEMAQLYGMTIAWENVSWGLYAYPEFGSALQEAAQTDYLRFTLDIKQAMRSGYSPYDFLKEMGDKLVNVHACDYVQTPARVCPALPGKGECDFRAVGTALRDSGYTGPVLFEVYSDLYKDEKEMLESYDYLKRCLQG